MPPNITMPGSIWEAHRELEQRLWWHSKVGIWADSIDFAGFPVCWLWFLQFWVPLGRRFRCMCWKLFVSLHCLLYFFWSLSKTDARTANAVSPYILHFYGRKSTARPAEVKSNRQLATSDSPDVALILHRFYLSFISILWFFTAIWLYNVSCRNLVRIP